MARPKGVTNKRISDFREALTKYMRRKGVNPHYFMVDLIADTTTRQVVVGDGAVVEMPTVSMDHKLQAAKELAQYLQPKLRAVELTGEDGGPLAFTVEMIQYAEAQDTPALPL